MKSIMVSCANVVPWERFFERWLCFAVDVKEEDEDVEFDKKTTKSMLSLFKGRNGKRKRGGDTQSVASTRAPSTGIHRNVNPQKKSEPTRKKAKVEGSVKSKFAPYAYLPLRDGKKKSKRK